MEKLIDWMACNLEDFVPAMVAIIVSTVLMLMVLAP